VILEIVADAFRIQHDIDAVLAELPTTGAPSSASGTSGAEHLFTAAARH